MNVICYDNMSLLSLLRQTEIEVDLMDIFDCIPPTVELPHRMRDLERYLHTYVISQCWKVM